MNTTLPRARSRGLAVPFAALALSAIAAAQQGGAPAPDSREAMWPAPTAEDWKKPVPIQWQRTWEDALAVAEETGKPILICVNMDGEIASEHYAGIRYRQPEITKLYEPYVTVIASVYRHNPRDYDEHGHRIPCPRFGTVTCGEHIAIEPILYEQFFDGQRIAPRHIMVELDGAETYDVFYAFDTASVFKAIEDGIANRAEQPTPVVRGDRTIIERVASRDSLDRAAVESAYAGGDKEMKERLLAAAAEHPDAAPLGLLRLAVFGFDQELSEAARTALAQTESGDAADLISEALRVPMADAERETLIATLSRLGAKSPRAKTLAVVHRGLGSKSSAVDVEGWAAGAGASYAANVLDRAAVETRLEESGRAVGAKPDDAGARLEFAHNALRLAVDPETSQILASDPRTGTKYARLMFEDARRAALDAERLGANGWRLDATLALASYYLGDLETAYARAEKAVDAIPAGTQEWSAVSTIAVFAQARQRAIARALRANEDWPGEWLTDVNAAYSVLAKHPLGTDEHVAAHYDFLRRLGADGRAARVLDEGLARFPESWSLHDCLRARILAEKGVEGLESTYEAMLAAPDASPNLEWFAGYASIVTAEYHRRRGEHGEALAAYQRAVAHYERCTAARPETKESSDHYVAVALGGSARVAYEAGNDEAAVGALLVSFARKESAANALDGLNISAVDTAKMVLARLRRDEKAELATKLQGALDALDPALLELPAYEGRGPRGGQGRRGGRGPGGRQGGAGQGPRRR